MEKGYLISDYFSDGEVWALLAALDVIAEETYLTDEQFKLVESAKNKILNSVE